MTSNSKATHSQGKRSTEKRDCLQNGKGTIFVSHSWDRGKIYRVYKEHKNLTSMSK
jgi:hypothetical protein